MVTMMKLALLFCTFLVIFGVRIEGKPLESTQKCGYSGCPAIDRNKLNVHLVPHSHDDVGWLKTVDQYYYGSKIRNYGRRDGVIYIINSVVRALKQNPKRKFIQVETAFLNKWWQQQTDKKRSEFQRLVENGQIELTGGAWSMNDEAAVHYQSVIDQFTLGLRLLNDTFGECGRPRVGWQIDPFGHTREMASIFANLGFDGLFFSRLDWRDKSERLNSKTGEILWRGSSSLGKQSNIFTSVLYNHYSAPSGFCFDVLCSDEPIVDDKESPEYNQKRKVEKFADFIRGQAEKYITNNIIITMGDDFNYQDALSYYQNMDKLIEGFEMFPQTYNNKSINVFYSTPSCYLKAVYDESTTLLKEFRVKRDDFIPYATDWHTYWSGYYTSRPTSKRYERQGNNYLQVIKQLTAFSNIEGDPTAPLKEAMGVMQHHDAITGTEKQHVADDYHRILSDAFEKSDKVASDAILKLLTKQQTQTPNLKLKSCLLSNVTHCDVTQCNKDFSVAVYNPLSRDVSYYVRLPVESNKFEIVDHQGKPVEYQITPAVDHFKYIPDVKLSKFELVFKAEIPALGVRVYTIAESDPTSVDPLPEAPESDKYTLGDKVIGATFDNKTKLVSSITVNGITQKVSQQFYYYLSAYGNNAEFANRSSGAYIFRPSPENNKTQSVAQNVELKTYKGHLVDEAHQVYNSWIKQIIRVYKQENYVEFDWIVGPIDIKDNNGKEIISHFKTELNTDDVFYTDSNGREMLKRKRNFRPTFNYTDEEPTAGNYYPITTRIVLKDQSKNTEFAVMNDRSQGGSSLKSGEVELMVHRRCLHDDAFGVGEQLNETQYGQGLVARGQHYVTLTTTTNGASIQRDIVQRKTLAPWVLIMESNRTELDKINKEFKGITRALPKNVQILTLESIARDKILVRFEHVFESNEDAELSKPATINLKELFTKFEVVSIRETTLGGNQWKKDNERLQWREGEDLGTEIEEESEENTDESSYEDYVEGDLQIELKPMEIRTFIADVKLVR